VQVTLIYTPPHLHFLLLREHYADIHKKTTDYSHNFDSCLYSNTAPSVYGAEKWAGLPVGAGFLQEVFAATILNIP
jgi:hypothetical protein